MTDEQAIRKVYEDMYRAMMDKDTVALGNLLSDDSILIHMTGHRQPRKEYLAEISAGILNYYSVDTDSLQITVTGGTARMVGCSRVDAAVYGGGCHTWRLRMDSQLRKMDGNWKITVSKVSTY
ncbi:MAG: nuclear transport factor 2 family protein [Bacteroidales bacterium]|nr:nuclear transport factor 2 family protein [Bacteroidales bacterium]